MKVIHPEQRVLDFIRRQRLVSSWEKVVVAVSGGPDSVCLLYILAALREELGISLHIAHLDHRLRGTDSTADARYVARMADRMGLSAVTESRDVRDYQMKHRLSPEEAAREVRYSFLADVAASVSAEKVAVGHTADDNAETVLMHLLRGSGTRGLRGLSPAGRWESGGSRVTVIRPLLELTRSETIDYCRKRRLRPRRDASNLSPEPFRNKIRLHLLPELEKYNPRIHEALMRTARIAADDLEFIEGEVSKQQDRAVRWEGNTAVFNKKEFLSLPVALKRHLLRNIIEGLLGTLKDIDAGHIESVLDALDKPSGRIIGLPEGLSFTIEYDRYLLSREPAALCPFPAIETETGLNVPGTTHSSGWTIEASFISPSERGALPPKDGLTAHFDFEKTGDRLTFRRRKAGDRFQPLGLPGPKKLNVFMINAHIPRAWRDNIPIVGSPGQIIWVSGYRIDHRVRVTETTKNVLRLEFKKDL